MTKWILALLACCAVTFSVTAAPLPQPEGPVILTISGKIQNTQDGQTARLDLAQLQRLESDTFTLQTRWSNSLNSYHGPLLSAVLNHVGAEGNHIRLTALNDYSVEFERHYMDQYEPILAWSEDGKQLSIRNKGPLWLILPHHKFPELTGEIHTGRMIWQLSRIEIY
ncbi:molybdopterin-dependent oxidoreductase [uncultured Amphritea sp.]|uniref:molybdopterin-dependent oxidoreductase n=1 Tax=uncultured Amphritea sp. TaxID=981605 RepID=UPI00262EC085|nr:molybdopterin-dependent oxidoreductase [uncultured Amphritea sp.]